MPHAASIRRRGRPIGGRPLHDHLLVLPLLDGDVLLLLPEPELPVEEDPDLPEVDDPEAPMAPVEPELEPPDCADDPELPDEPPLAESEPPPLPQAASETTAEAAMARMALRERVDACMGMLQ